MKFIFENKFFIFIGNISYSFYLWHLPIIYFYELYFLDNIFKVPLLFILTTVLSFLTYTFIEQKFRYLKFSSALLKRNIYIVISFIFVSIILIFYFSSQKSYENVVKNNFKNLIHNLNFLERKLNYSDRTVFYKININGKGYDTKDGTPERDFIHIKDLCEIHEKTYRYLNKNKNVILNCGSGTRYSVLGVIKEFEKKLKKKFIIT